ncbi:hypothetical protein NX059_002819 [Plenodomus lindquistii]|nr:hypothetical protein NX059_002819 [Plenodomus lindquistii]
MEMTPFDSASFRRMHEITSDNGPESGDYERGDLTLSERLSVILQIARDANESDRDRISHQDFLASIGILPNVHVALDATACDSPLGQASHPQVSQAPVESKYEPHPTVVVSTATQADLQSAHVQALIAKAEREGYERGWRACKEQECGRERFIRYGTIHTYGFNASSLSCTSPPNSVAPEVETKPMSGPFSSFFDGPNKPTLNEEASVARDSITRESYEDMVETKRTKAERIVVKLPPASQDHRSPSALAGFPLKKRLHNPEAMPFTPKKITVTLPSTSTSKPPHVNGVLEDKGGSKENIAPRVLLKDPFQSLLGLARMK